MHLSKEQAQFRKNMRTIEHIHTMTILSEKVTENNITMWVAFVFRMALGTVEF